MRSKEDIRLYQKEYRQRNRLKLSKYRLAWQRKNRSKCAKYNRDHYFKNVSEIRIKANKNYTLNKCTKSLQGAIYYRKNTAAILTRTGAHQKRNRAYYNAMAAKRRAALMQRTPRWLTKEQRLEIQQFYIDCKELQWLSDKTDQLTVDHIVPLQGEFVSGLHVPWNLQILTLSNNSIKRNKYV